MLYTNRTRYAVIVKQDGDEYSVAPGQSFKLKGRKPPTVAPAVSTPAPSSTAAAPAPQPALDVAKADEPTLVAPPEEIVDNPAAAEADTDLPRRRRIGNRS